MCDVAAYWHTDLPHALEAYHAVDALEEAYSRFGKPEIVNTDQGNQLIAQSFVDAVLNQGVKFSMDGRGAWQTIKYGPVYLRAYDSVSVARKDIALYIDWYNM